MVVSGYGKFNYSDVIMGAIAPQITSLTIVYSSVYSGTDKRKLQSSASLAFVWGIAYFHLMTSSCYRTEIHATVIVNKADRRTDRPYSSRLLQNLVTNKHQPIDHHHADLTVVIMWHKTYHTTQKDYYGHLTHYIICSAREKSH